MCLWASLMQARSHVSAIAAVEYTVFVYLGERCCAQGLEQLRERLTADLEQAAEEGPPVAGAGASAGAGFPAQCSLVCPMAPTPAPHPPHGDVAPHRPP